MSNAIELRPLGAGTARISGLGFGCMGLVGWYGTRDDAEAEATLQAALQAGITHFDTAASYQLGENEKFVGRVLGPRRSEVVIASKCGLVRGADGAAIADNSAAVIRQSLDASLQRLGTDYLDLFYLHRIDPRVPIEESVGVLADLVHAGKIRAIGLSECSISTLRRAAAVHPIAAVQTEYSLWSRDPEGGMLQACEALGTTFVAYSPLGRGFLAGNFRQLADLPPTDHRRSNPRFQEVAAAHNAALVEALRDTAAGLGATAAQVAIAWVLSRSARVVTIPGMKTRAHLHDNLGAARLVLDAATRARLDALAQELGVQGERHPPAMMNIIDREV